MSLKFNICGVLAAAAGLVASLNAPAISAAAIVNCAPFIPGAITTPLFCGTATAHAGVSASQQTVTYDILAGSTGIGRAVPVKNDGSTIVRRADSDGGLSCPTIQSLGQFKSKSCVQKNAGDAVKLFIQG
jgi:hypothetical protein